MAATRTYLSVVRSPVTASPSQTRRPARTGCREIPSGRRSSRRPPAQRRTPQEGPRGERRARYPIPGREPPPAPFRLPPAPARRTCRRVRTRYAVPRWWQVRSPGESRHRRQGILQRVAGRNAARCGSLPVTRRRCVRAVSSRSRRSFRHPPGTRAAQAIGLRPLEQVGFCRAARSVHHPAQQGELAPPPSACRARVPAAGWLPLTVRKLFCVDTQCHASMLRKRRVASLDAFRTLHLALSHVVSSTRDVTLC